MGLGGTENIILSLCKEMKKDYDITVVSAGGANVVALEKMNIKHITIPDISTKNPIKVFKIIKDLKKILNNNFDIVHTHHRMAAFYLKLLIKSNNTKFIHTMHNSFFDKIKMTRYALKNATVVACGNSVKENIQTVYNISDVVVINNGIDIHYNKECILEIKQERQKNRYVFGFVGRLAKQKGIDVLLNAFKYIDNAALFIYGDGEQKKICDDYIKLNGLSNKIFMMGKTDNPLNVIEQIDCLILPSRWEGLPLNIIEAFAVKTLVLCSDIDNNLELVDDQCGYVFEKDNVHDLVEKMNSLMNDDSKTKIDNAFDKYIKSYTYEDFITKYNEIYK